MPVERVEDVSPYLNGSCFSNGTGGMPVLFFKKLFIILMLSLLAYAVFPASSLAPFAFADAAADEKMNARAKQALRTARLSLDLQLQIPDRPEIKEENRLLDKLPPVRPERVFNIAGLAEILLIFSVAAILVIVLLNFKDNLWSSSRARNIRNSESEEAETIAVAGRMDKAQYAADELAASGNYAEAMHVLLLQSVNELRLRLDMSIASSLTSREILHKVNLSAQGKEMFSDIVSRVEVSWFGFHTPGAEDYRACRESFEALTHSLMELIQREGVLSAETGGTDSESGITSVSVWRAKA